MNNETEKNIRKKEDTQLPPDTLGGPSLPPQIEEFLNKSKAPADVKRIIGQMGAFQFMAPSVNPIVQKLSPQHIDKLLDYSHQESQNSYKLESHGRWFHLTYALFIIAFLAFLVIFLAKDNAVLFSDILKVLVVFAGGFGSGFGFKTYIEKKK